MRRFDKSALIKKILKDILRLLKELTFLAFRLIANFFVKVFIPFFLLSVLAFALTYVLLNGINEENIKTAVEFAKQSVLSPLSLLPLYAQWYHDIFENGFHASSRYFLAQVLPAAPVVFGAFGCLSFLLFVPALPYSKNGRRARLDFISELLHNIKENKRGFTDEEFYASREEPPELERDAFEDEFFNEDDTEDISSSLKMLYVGDGVTIFGKETFYDEWAKKTRLAVILCTPKEANGFFIQAFYKRKLRNRACQNIKGFYRDLSDEQAAEEIKKIQAGILDFSRYDKLIFWENPPLSWRKAKVMFCMLPNADINREK